MKYLPIILIFITFFIIRFLSPNTVGFYGDSARDLLIVDLMHDGKYFPIIGHENMTGYNVPIYYYILYLGSFITGSSYSGILWLYTFWRFIGLGIFFYLLKEFDLSDWEAALFTLVAGVSNETLRMVREIFSINLIFPLSILTVLLLLKSVKRNNSYYHLLSIIPLILAVAIDLSSLLLIPVYWWWLFKIKASRKRKISIFILSTLVISVLFWWVFSINTYVYGGINSYFEHLRKLITGYPVIPPTTWKQIIHDFLSNTVWINQNVRFLFLQIDFKLVSIVGWFYFGAFFITGFWRGRIFKYKPAIFITALFSISLIGLIFFNLLTQQLFSHHLNVISFLPILFLVIVWKNFGKLHKIIVGAFIFVFIVQQGNQIFTYNNVNSDITDCMKTAYSLKYLASDIPFALIYIDYNNNTWDTTKYFYCLRQIGVNLPVTLLGGSFGIGQIKADLFNNSSNIFPGQALMICKKEISDYCQSIFKKEYSSYWNKLQIKEETNDLVLAKFIKS